jgi:hypothetical protein
MAWPKISPSHATSSHSNGETRDLVFLSCLLSFAVAAAAKKDDDSNLSQESGPERIRAVGEKTSDSLVGKGVEAVSAAWIQLTAARNHKQIVL